jgi:hypothetical protein
MDNNVKDFMTFKANATAAAASQDENKPDVDAFLAKLGLDRASVDMFFAQYVTNEEEEAPDVAHWRNLLKGHRELLTLLQEAAAKAQADFAAAIKAERDIEVRIMLEKVDHLRKIKRRQLGMPDETIEKPKRKRKSRRS